MNSKTVSVIATVCRRFKDLKDFCESFYKTSDNDFNELILVSNGSSSEIIDYLNKLNNKDGRVKVIYNDINYGLGFSTDQAAHIAKGDYLFRCDTDLYFNSNGWIPEMIKVADSNEIIGSVGTSMNCGGLRVWKSNFVETDIIIGCCQCVPRRTIKRIEQKLDIIKPRLIEAIDKKLKIYQKDCVENQIMKDSPEDIFTRVSKLKRSIEKCRDLALVGNWVLKGEGYWDPNFYYGIDDQDFSLLQRYFGLKLAMCDTVNIEHRNASLDDKWKLSRHWNVWNGAHYIREKWEILLNRSWDGCYWNCHPLNEDYREKYKTLEKYKSVEV